MHTSVAVKMRDQKKNGVGAADSVPKWPHDYPYANGEGQPREWLHAGEVSREGFADLLTAFGSDEVALCTGCAGGTAENPTGIVALIRATPENLAKAWFEISEKELVEAGLKPEKRKAKVKWANGDITLEEFDISEDGDPLCPQCGSPLTANTNYACAFGHMAYTVIDPEDLT